MKNPDYHPDKAHLPNAEDIKRWENGGKQKDKKEREKLARVRAKWDAVTVLRGW